MTELVLEHDEGLIHLGEKTLVVAIDDTGHEEFQDPNHRVFGLGGCAFMVRDYQKLVEQPWNYMCERFFPDQKRPMHAADIRFSSEQMDALKHFFEKFQFFRVATTASHNTLNEIDRGFVDIVGACLLQRICEIAKWAEFDRLFILFEASDRIETKVITSLSGKKIQRGTENIQIELAIMPKSSCTPALEVADFIIHTAGAQTRARNEGAKKARVDFEIIFRNVDKRLTSFMEITKVKDVVDA
jgi:hypothetical protein